jgi:4-amino-4-deoxy-L-arabinose transferase-like glycosyltransferase
MADHRALSRIGLTDVPFGLLLLLALWAFGHLLQRRQWRHAVLAGLCTGLAWNCKYHGWLAVPIAGLAALPQLLREPGRLRLLGLFALAGSVAAALFAPWAIWVATQEGGYRALAQNHLSYLQAAPQYLEHALAQLQAQQVFDDQRALLALPLAAVVMAVSLRVRRAIWLRVGTVALLGSAVAVWVGSAAAVGVLAGWSVLRLLRGMRGGARVVVGGSLALALFVCFSLLTPLYHPYARLLLPWRLAAALLAGALLQHLLLDEARWPARGTRLTGALGVTIAILGLCFQGLPAPRVASQPDFRAAATAIAEHVTSGEVVLVASEPAVCFYLRELGVSAWPTEGTWALDGAGANTTVLWVAGLYSRRRREVEQWHASNPGARVDLVVTVAARCGLVRLLDDYEPFAARLQAQAEPTPHRCAVYRIRK